jgi:AraC-like DNA-binding protein
MSKKFIADPPALSTGKRSAVNSTNQRFCKAFAFLVKHCYEPIGVNDLVKVSELSRRGLHKAFKKHVGQGPGRELRQMRIRRAKDLLANSNHKLKTIAKMCGYRSNNSFWISFRGLLGESPGEFRSRVRKNFSQTKNGQPVSSGDSIATVKLLPNVTDYKGVRQLVQNWGTNQPPADTRKFVFEGRIIFEMSPKITSGVKSDPFANTAPLQVDAYVRAI